MVDIIEEFREYNCQIDVYDPWVSIAESEHEYGITPLTTKPADGQYDAVILAVSHKQFKEMGLDKIKALGKPNAVIYDVKYLFPAGSVDGRL